MKNFYIYGCILAIVGPIVGYLPFAGSRADSVCTFSQQTGNCGSGCIYGEPDLTLLFCRMIDGGCCTGMCQQVPCLDSQTGQPCTDPYYVGRWTGGFGNPVQGSTCSDPDPNAWGECQHNAICSSPNPPPGGGGCPE